MRQAPEPGAIAVHTAAMLWDLPILSWEEAAAEALVEPTQAAEGPARCSTVHSCYN